MNLPSGQRIFFWVFLGTGFFSAPLVFAQSPAVVANPSATRNVTAPSQPPLPPVKSPVDLFRELLAMSPLERQMELSKRPSGIRERIAAKLKEYSTMKPDERELRLRMTQVRWGFLSSINLGPELRDNFLAQLQDADRALVNERLEKWDRLPVDEQKVILQYEKTVGQFAGKNLDGAAATNQIVSNVSVTERESALKNLDDFLKLPVGQRMQICSGFQHFFELSEGEKQKTLESLPLPQRGMTSGSLSNILHLPKEQRAQYIEALKKFSALSDQERGEFLRNAERWRQLSPAERQAWRTLVNRIASQPPLPPDMITPPLPPLPLVQHPERPVITNGS